MDEQLRGQPVTAIGTSNQIAGELSVDLTNPQRSSVGTIQVNARTLETDQNFRNRAIQNEILQTGSYEFITFVPTEVAGLPNSLAVGETITFQITGDLTIREITQQVTFDVTATLVAADRIAGLASTTVLRSDYNLVIPSVPSVANVSEEVLLEIDFVATAQ
ncbi:MAG: YceI family protein [Anaerolineae bacterium]|nr:YceI family protein [Anaerolineae bacterium]